MVQPCMFFVLMRTQHNWIYLKHNNQNYNTMWWPWTTRQDAINSLPFVNNHSLLYNLTESDDNNV